MVIHHDKMAYGRLDSLTEKLSDERLAKMAKMLSDGQEERKEGSDSPVKKAVEKSKEQK